MSNRKPYFILSKLTPFPDRQCDKCDNRIMDTGDGKLYWNPNPRACVKNICSKCYAEWIETKESKLEKSMMKDLDWQVTKDE